MRVPLLLMALATTPFVAAAAQNGSAAVKDPAQCAVADANRSPQSWSRDQKPDPQGRSRTGCSPVTPSGGTTGDPPPPPPDTTPPPPGSVSIDGTVYNEATWGGLQGWTVTVSGPVNSSTVTDATGHYVFSGIPAGTYTVCEVLQSNWVEAFPTSGADCSGTTGNGPVGYSVTVGSNGSVGDKDFGNSPLSNVTVTFNPLVTGKTHATSISCVDKNGASVGSASNANTLTTNNVRVRQSSMVCTVTYVDP